MRKLLLLTLAVIVSFASTFVFHGSETTEASSIFSDVNSYEVNLLAQQQIIRGYDDQTFRPNNHVTRAEAVTMIGRALGFDDTQQETIFPDVKKEHYASGLVQLGVEHNIISGYDDGTFQPRNSVTRGEMAVFIDRAFTLNKTRNITFNDINRAMFSYNSIVKLAESGVTVGYADGTYRAGQPITRLEFALFLARAIYPELRPAPTQVSAYGTVVNAPNHQLEIRTGPSKNYPALTQTLPNNTDINIYATINNFAYMEAGDLKGYISLDYIEIAPLSASNILRGLTIVVDPGHGGTDPGASANGLVEKELALEVGLIFRDKLKAAGANVVMTRSTDVYLKLEERVQVAHNAKADAFISIHANSFTDPRAHGTETFWNSKYTSAESKELAETIQKHLIAKLKTNDRGAKNGNFHVIRETTMPSVLVELGFLSNKEEAEYMKTAKFKDATAEAMLQGVIEYYKR